MSRSNTKTIAGPWEYSRLGTPDYDPHFGVWSEEHPNDFCIVKGAESNAKLIAAAPELLEALQLAVKVMQDGNMDEIMSDEFEIFTDAINKATT